LKVLLDRAPGLKNTRTEVVYDGWPSDVSDLDTADTIVFLSDGMQWSPWTFTPERIAAIQKQSSSRKSSTVLDRSSTTSDLMRD
jgi:hypothetical protein